MNQVTGHLAKMKTNHQEVVHYDLRLDECQIPLNERIGQVISLEFTGRRHCVSCGKSIRKTYQQGYCFPCTQALASCDICMVKPELCHFDKGTCREPAWAARQCMIHHYVYLANSSGLKVGITRHHQIPTRWMDQGAVQAIPILRVDSRMQSGLVETACKAWVSDRTHWQKMLKGDPEARNLEEERERILDEMTESLASLRATFGEQAIQALPDEPVRDFVYPVHTYPQKVKSLNFDKQAVIESRLLGIKGQYLIMEAGVLNVRKFSGYEVTWSQ